MADEKVVAEETPEEVEEVEESTEEEQEESTETTEEDLDENSLVQAKALYKLLKDPNTRDNTVRMMAESAGLLGRNAPETKTEVKEAA